MSTLQVLALILLVFSLVKAVALFKVFQLFKPISKDKPQEIDEVLEDHDLGDQQ
ncbi:hypothetical protein ACMZ6Z_04820 [Streptococcus pluranimalium]|uniref:hypothetical protein n=1 Tax=Streptococcus pluranimalium TaxID=82348 RepID=UPI0039FDAE5D